MNDAIIHVTSLCLPMSLVEGAGHFLHREKPNEVVRSIVDWLR